MPNVMLHNVPPQVHRALKSRAAQTGRSVEAEILAIVEQAVRPKASAGMGFDFADIVRSFGGDAGPPKVKPEGASE